MNAKPVLVLMTASAVIADSLLHPFYPQYFEQIFGIVDPTYIGLYMAACSLTVMVFCPIWARIAERVPVPRLLIVTQLAAGLLSLACAAIDSITWFWVISLAMLVCKASYLLVYPHLLSFEGKERHLTTIGLLAFVVHFGNITSALLSGVVFQWADPRSLFLVMALGDLLQIGLCLLLPSGRAAVPDAADPSEPEAQPRRSARFVAKLGCVMALVYFSAHLSDPFFATYWEQVSSLDNKIVSGLVYAIPGLAALAGLLLSAARRRDPARSPYQRVLPALALAIVSLALQAASSSALIVLGRIAYGAALFSAMVRLDALLFQLSAAETYAIEFGNINLFQGAGVLAASFAAGALVDASSLDDGSIEYLFRARVLPLFHWDIEFGSLRKRVAGEPTELDALSFFIELRERLKIPQDVLPVYLEEIGSTLFASAYKHTHQRWTAGDLVHAPFQTIEAAMSEGHPVFVANSGRVGFDARDYVAYAPESARPVRLVWLAVRRAYAQISSVTDLSYERLLDEELGADVLASFASELTRLGLHPEAYVFMPVHPWQWFNQLSSVFAADLATRDLICLGYGEDEYRAQQSIRTFFNLTAPHRRYVKTALSVLNMGFMRGLSADYMENTPAINDWVDALLARDPYFAAHGFSILREVAAIGYRSPRTDLALSRQSPYRKMVAALWRESPVPRLAYGQRCVTMAALLHRDREGRALLPQLIASSGLAIDTWLDRYLSCYLAPLLHCFYAYDLAFMPHGENVILVLENGVPVRALLKDIAEEVVVMDESRVLPERVQRIVVSVPARLKLLSIFTDVFDDFFRYLSQILLEQADHAPARFWERVAACIRDYARSHPGYAGKLAEHDPFAPEFLHSCLNRLQLRDNKQMIDLSDPAKNLQFAGTLVNPIAGLGS